MYKQTSSVMTLRQKKSRHVLSCLCRQCVYKVWGYAGETQRNRGAPWVCCKARRALSRRADSELMCCCDTSMLGRGSCHCSCARRAHGACAVEVWAEVTALPNIHADALLKETRLAWCSQALPCSRAAAAVRSHDDAVSPVRSKQASALAP